MLNIVAVRVDVEGLYVRGVVALSIYKAFEVGEIMGLLNGIKYVPLVLSLVRATVVAEEAFPIRSKPFIFRFPAGSKKGAGDRIESNDLIPLGLVVAGVITKLLFV